MPNEKKFYVYVHRRASDGKVFYVGKGGGKKSRSKDVSNRNKLWHEVVRTHGFFDEILKCGMSEVCALSFERLLIHIIGRSELVNQTSGGQGTSGRIVSSETRNKNRIASTGIKRSLDSRKKQSASLIGKPQSPEQIKNRADALRGKPLSPSHAEIARNAAAKRRCICVETGVEFPSLECATAWLKVNGFPNASSGNPSRSCKTGYSAYGFHWNYVK